MKHFVYRIVIYTEKISRALLPPQAEHSFNIFFCHLPAASVLCSYIFTIICVTWWEIILHMTVNILCQRVINFTCEKIQKIIIKKKKP